MNPWEIQQLLALEEPRYAAPVMGLGTAAGLLRLPSRRVIERLELGLVCGWNIARESATARELRLLTASVAAHRQAPDRPVAISAEEAARLVIPQDDRPWLTGTALQRALGCSHTHIMDLIGDRALSCVPRSTWRRGPGGSPLISRESLDRFLTARFL